MDTPTVQTEKRTPERIIDEYLSRGKTLEYIRRIATAREDKALLQALRGWVDSTTVTVKHGLLYRGGCIIPVNEADHLAREEGFAYAEQLVEHLSKA